MAYPHDLVVELETCEMESIASLCDAASPEAAEACGLQCLHLRAGLVLIASRLDVLALNRVVGVGLAGPPTERDLLDVREAFREAGVPRFFVQASPIAATEAFSVLMRQERFEPYNNWVKLSREAGPVASIALEGAVRVESIGPERAALFASIVRTGFGWDPIIDRWIADSVGRAEGWSHYIAYVEEEPIGAAMLFVRGRSGSLSFATTLPEHRRRGGQAALLARRLLDGLEAGVRRFGVETAEPGPDRDAPSFRNVTRLGFDVAYLRPNWIDRFAGETRVP